MVDRMRFVRLCIAIALVAGGAVVDPAEAAEIASRRADGEEPATGLPLPEDSGLAELIRYARDHNPTLKSAYHTYRAALELRPGGRGSGHRAPGRR